MELLLPHLDGTLMNQVNNVKTDSATNKQTIVAHPFPPYRHRFHEWLEPQRSAGLQNVYLDPSYLVLGTQHNPSPPPHSPTLGCIYMELWDVSAVPHQSLSWKQGRLQIGKKFEPHRLGKASRSIYMRKNCPTWKGYPTRHGKTTRPSESLALRDEFAIFMWMVG